MATVKKYMKKRVTTIGPDERIETIWRLIFKKNFHAVPVVSKTNKLLGIIAEEDLLQSVYPDYADFIRGINGFNIETLKNDFREVLLKKARTIMNRVVFVTQPDVDIFRALSKMLILQVRQLPVVDSRYRVIGVISRGDIFNALFTRYSSFKK